MQAFIVYVPESVQIRTESLEVPQLLWREALLPYAPCTWVVAETKDGRRGLLHFESQLAFDWRSGEMAEWLDVILGIDWRAPQMSTPATPVRVEGVPVNRTTYHIIHHVQSIDPRDTRRRNEAGEASSRTGAQDGGNLAAGGTHTGAQDGGNLAAGGSDTSDAASGGARGSTAAGDDTGTGRKARKKAKPQQ